MFELDHRAGLHLPRLSGTALQPYSRPRIAFASNISVRLTPVNQPVPPCSPRLRQQLQHQGVGFGQEARVLKRPADELACPHEMGDFLHGDSRRNLLSALARFY